MIFNCLTIFPEMFMGFTQSSLASKAIQSGLIQVNTVNFRDYTTDKHKRVDDYPFGGGAGMLLCAQPLFDCFSDIKQKFANNKTLNVYMSPAGKTLTQSAVYEYSEQYEVVNILCGHYEGVDQRVLDEHIDEEISIGDYVLTGGELPAMVFMDSLMRYVPGVVSNHISVCTESFSEGLLEYPQYTRPQEFRGETVPEVLLSGHHKKIEEWQREKSLEKTYRVRPDLLSKAELTEKDKEFLAKLQK